MMSLTDLSILSEKGLEEAVRNYELVKRREQKKEDKVTLEELEKERVEALELVEKEREIVEQERDVYDKIADKLSKRHMSLITYWYTDSLTQKNSRVIYMMPCTHLMRSLQRQ